MSNDIIYNIALSGEPAIPQRTVVGEIIAPNKQFKCEIMLNDSMVSKYEMRDIFLSLMPLKPLQIPQYKIFVTEEFFHRLQKKDANAFFKLYHELGHIHNHDLLRSDAPTEEERAAALRGEPSDADLAADRFAKKYMGLKNSVKALRAIKKEREELCTSKCSSEKAQLNRAAVLDAERRIDAIMLK
ncbi:MAG: hypothetical protein IKV45_00620 [Firmicutes bacterium]|nr:hypothetical protein [Bacillota bacterium]